MAYTIRPVEYYYVNVRDELGAAYRVLSALAARGVSLLAFTAVPSGPSLAQFALFPDDPNKLVAEARAAQIVARRPASRAARAGRRRARERWRRCTSGSSRRGVDVYASSGVTDGGSSFGYVVYVREDQFLRAVEALGL